MLKAREVGNARNRFVFGSQGARERNGVVVCLVYGRGEMIHEKTQRLSLDICDTICI